MSEIEDEELLRLAQTGGEAGFTGFVTRHQGPLLRYLLHQTGNIHRAEDLLQEVFLRVFNAGKSGRWQGRSNIRTWLFAIARNIAIDDSRRRASRVTTGEAADMHVIAADKTSDPIHQATQRESIVRTEKVLAQLPQPQREVLGLRIFGNLSFPEIADVTQTSLPTVKSRMRYALDKAREILLQHEREIQS